MFGGRLPSVSGTEHFDFGKKKCLGKGVCGSRKLRMIRDRGKNVQANYYDSQMVRDHCLL